MTLSTCLRRRWAAVLLCLAAASCAIPAAALTATPPLAIPFAVRTGGETAHTDLRIAQQGIYRFGLTFQAVNVRDSSEVYALLDLMGDAENPYPSSASPPPNYGVPLSLSLRIERLEPGPVAVVFDRTTDQVQRYAGFGGRFLKKIGDVTLDRGVYRVTVKNLRPAAQLSNLSVHIHINKAYLGK
ncbi:DUF5625 family protein [Pseudoduganella armeniaca]|uniref:DUF5625 domain-containing protein n=1 Tax=Pseudoduganella armeniaca TaxID=2072590 RepID=A0A2R4CGS0_9BURK|nr:DUF5625 family protein [Pseudoduganella armeniaca]AVR98824.1 hypothetical protein C9I28_26795 [Pseudoduganella armeniaca]